MDELAKRFGKLGFKKVKTILASGNVVFSSDEQSTNKIAQAIAVDIEKKIGRKISVIVRTMDEIKKLDASNPFKGAKITPTTKTFITFIPDYKKSMNRDKPTSHDNYTIMKIVDGMIVSYLHEKPGLGTLDLMEGIEKEFGKHVTTRTWNTIQKVIKAGA